MVISQSETNGDKHVNENSDIEYDSDLGCGIGKWRPKWLQKLANPKIFVVNFALVAIFQGASFTYLIGSISTLEKRYSFESKWSGFILIADNLSQMIVNPFIGYLGGKYNKPRIMAIGEIIVAISCFMSSFPYFIFGPSPELLTTNATNDDVCKPLRDDQCPNQNTGTEWTAVAILWSASFINGLGYTAFYTVGLPYIDDSTSKKNSPIYLSTTSAVRLFGPTLGFLLSFYCLRFYENPFATVNIRREHPGWIGAWWIGFIVIGTCLTLCSIPLFMYPANMKLNKTNESNDDDGKKMSRKEMFQKFIRLIRNPIFVFHMFGTTMRLLGYLGYYIFKPKYIEAQFRKSASDASFWTGITSIPTMVIGIMTSGIVLSYFKPSPRKLMMYILFAEIFTSFAILSAMFLRCPTPLYPKTTMVNDNLNLDDDCNFNCKCSKRFIKPVCANDGISNYFSPCYAGCTEVQQLGQSKNFSNCKCIGLDAPVKNGRCPADCDKFPYYLAVLGIAGLISSSARIGDILITLRCVDPKDKSFAMGIIGSFMAVFAFIPYPLIFGAITDNACILWKEWCGKRGNCWIYDVEKFANYLHIGAFIFLMIGMLFNIPIVFFANRLGNMFDDDEDDDKVNAVNRKNSHELGTINNGFIDSSEENNKDINRLKVEEPKERRGSIEKEYELIYRKNSYVSI